MEDRAVIREMKDWTKSTDKRKQELFYLSNSNAFLIITQDCSLEELNRIIPAIIECRKRNYIKGLRKLNSVPKIVERRGNEFVVRG